MLNSPSLEISLLSEEELAELNQTYALCIDERMSTPSEKPVGICDKNLDMLSEDALIKHLLSLSISSDDFFKTYEEEKLAKPTESISTNDEMDDSPTNYSNELNDSAYKAIVVDLARHGGEIEAQGLRGYNSHLFDKELAEEAAKYGELAELYTQEFMEAFNFKLAEMSQAFDGACGNPPRIKSIR